MLRRALTYQLILAVAVGPLLCCCSVGKLLAGSHLTSCGMTSATSPRSNGPVERESHSCCSHKHQPADSDPGQQQNPVNPGQSKGKCPCKDGSGQPQTTQAESAQVSLSSFLRTLALDSVFTVDFPSASEILLSARSGLNEQQSSGHPQLTTAALLYAHHNLRC